MADHTERIRVWLTKQRNDLINMSRRNRLLYFKHTKAASLEIVRPSATEVLQQLNRNRDWGFHLPSGEPGARGRASSELEVDGKDAVQIEKALRLMERKSNQEFIDRGVWVLYLGVGMVQWIEAAGEAPTSSPLLLLPVTISRNSLREPFRLRRSDDDAVVNPALTVKFRSDFDLALPTAEDYDELEFEALLADVGSLVAAKPGWSVEDRVVMSTFTFQKEAMYRDLLDNEALLAADPLIQLLALGPDAPSAGTFDFDAVPEERLDHEAVPEDLVSVRDADASQRACIIAARQGRSFVMDGPPGSGKSQTITNIIAELMHAGKSVLFVSEKAAALDVVYNRLKEAQLDDFVLKLHSHDANRKVVATELNRALTSRPRADDGFPLTSRAELVKRREALSAYAQAMNEVRRPLGRSLHQVLGSISALGSVPQAPVPRGYGRELDPDRLAHLRTTAARLGRAWAPVTRGDEFLWRDLADVSTSASRNNELQLMLEKAVEALRVLRSGVDVIDEEVGLGWSSGPADAQRLLDLLALLDDRYDVPTAWLSTDSVEDVDARIAELTDLSAEHTRLANELAHLVRARPSDIDPAWVEQFRDARAGLAKSPWRPHEDFRRTDVEPVVEFLQRSGPALDEIHDMAKQLAALFGFEGSGISLDRALELVELGELVASPVLPEATWLNPAVQAALAEAVHVLGTLLDEFRSRREALRSVFTDDVLNLDLAALKVRFDTTHRGLRKFGSACRRDKRALSAHTVTGRVDRTVLESLGEAAAWQDLANRLAAQETRHAHMIGDHYYERGTADFARISDAIAVAQRALDLVGDQLAGPAFTAQLARGGSPDPQLLPTARRLRTAVERWLDEARGLIGDGARDLAALPLSQAVTWCVTAARQSTDVLAVLDHLTRLRGEPVAIATAEQALRVAMDAQEIEDGVLARHDDDESLLGSSYRGLDTDWSHLRAAHTWADRVRHHLGGPVHPRVAAAVLGSTATSADLEDRLASWTKAAAEVVDEFTGDRAAEVAATLRDDFDGASDLLDALLATTSEVAEWDAHVTARAELAEAGLGEVVDFCVERRVAGAEVAGIVERAVLEAWADDVLKHDHTRLGALRAGDRDALVEEFRKLDRSQVAHAAARVINACTARRPAVNAGPAAEIKRQAELQRRHKPIRTLLDRAGAVAQKVKPCFMMSPLSVSQYLPGTLRFDVVIFDEASQVRPADAVNCVYRGKQLIVAGDQKQLPPSDFFVRVGTVDGDAPDDEQVDDFESLLDLCKGAGALKSLPLNWHYRSEHEALITYSNYRFYEGTLWTFPGATHSAPDVGIEVFKVDGVYRRGATRDNPVEAAKVIERVRHHRLHHPELTLGVVTFSAAQEDAIEQELERQVARYPELAALRTDDRLHGFFVKNLENVQGDERDVIIFSVGYGPDEHGDFKLNIPSLTKESGWRRLNVAITRAKRRVEVVTSVTPGDFEGKTLSKGTAHLRRYLDFAERGVDALALDLTDSLGGAESPFEDEVLRTITGWGYDVVPQVGVAGYRIDLGVRHPARPGTYALGVECDGAMYHSSKVARDRDRLRQQVLEGLDWRIHRIWGTSWYRDRSGQEARLRAAIEEAVNGTGRPRSAELPEVPVVRVEEADLDAPPAWTTPYRPIALGTPNTYYDIHEPEARRELSRLVETAVRHDGPVHEDRVLAAVREAWGKWKSGPRIKEAFARVVRDLTRSALDRDEAGFLRTKFSHLDEVRVPTDDETTHRPVKHLPPEELRLAVLRFIADAQPIGRDELTSRVAKLFGWQRRGTEIQAALDVTVERLLLEGTAIEEGELLKTLAPTPPTGAGKSPRTAPPPAPRMIRPMPRMRPRP
ncbi:DUF3320 domain-containing protein [Actinosynnema sp. CA-248983]